jgi:hypothetical protein
MAIIIFAAIRGNGAWVMKYTRWAKTNPFKAQVLITFLQIILMAIGLIAGYNFKELGFQITDTTAFVFGSIMVFCFLLVPFLPKRNTIVIPKEYFRKRLAYLGIAVSSFVLMVYQGNRTEEKHPDSLITHVVKTIDQAIFSVDEDQLAIAEDEVSDTDYDNYNKIASDAGTTQAVFASFVVTENESIVPNALSKKEAKAKLLAEKKAKKLEKKKTKLMKMLQKHRAALAGGSVALGIILIILLVIPLCAGICLILSGAGFGEILLGIVLAGGSIFGIIKAGKMLAPQEPKEVTPK